MKVAIDISKLNKLSKQRGIGFYTQNLIDSLRKYTSVELAVVEKESSNKFDVIHYPFFDLFSPTLPIKKTTPTVITIHDVTPLKFPKQYPPGLKGKLAHIKQKISLKNIRAVITDSISSKKDIVEMLGIPEEKVFPIYLSHSEDFQIINDQEALEKITQKYSLPKNFVLYTGSINWNKNLLNLAEACINSNTHLVCVGAGFETKTDLDHPELKSFKQFINKYINHELIHILGFIPTQDLVGVMNLSKAVMLVSFYEGFGLPILEGQACGTAVITSRISSMPEVAGEGAVYIDPANVQSIQEAVSKIISDDIFRKDVILKGKQNLKKFSWEKTATETLEVYRYAKNN